MKSIVDTKWSNTMPGKKNVQFEQSDAILRLTRANVHLAKGIARAAAFGLETFVDRLDPENLFARDVNGNGFLLGALDGWVAALLQGAQLADQAFEMWYKPPKAPHNGKTRKQT
jgi:hypothetical protein